MWQIVHSESSLPEVFSSRHSLPRANQPNRSSIDAVGVVNEALLGSI
jgi:hypothetical protein